MHANPFAWKEYPLTDSLTVNNNGMIELKIDSSDAILKGSKDSYKDVQQVFNRYHLRADAFKLEKDSYFKGCQRNPDCQSIVSASNADVINAHI